MNKKESRKKYLFIRAAFVILSVTLFRKFMTFLTKYPPFSSFWQDRFFHYQNQDVYVSRKKINDLVADIAGKFDVRVVDRDQYFLSLIGRFDKLNKKSAQEQFEHIAARLEKEDMLLRRSENEMMKVLIKRT